MRINQKRKKQKTQGCQLQKFTSIRIAHSRQKTHTTQKTQRLKEFLPDIHKQSTQVCSKVTIKFGTKQIVTHSTRNLKNHYAAITSIKQLALNKPSMFSDEIMRELHEKTSKKTFKTHEEQYRAIDELFELSNKLNSQLFSYLKVENIIELISQLVTLLALPTLAYRTFAMFGSILFEYSNFSLSLFYLDRALKKFYDRSKQQYSAFERKIQLKLYSLISLIFLLKGCYGDSKKFAYKYLRIAWHVGDVNQQMQAYDLLGKIHMQMQDMNKGRYFHHRMTKGQRQKVDIMQMSKQQLQKWPRELKLACYETVLAFVEQDSPFNQILDNYYQVQSNQFIVSQGISQKENGYVFLKTHLSPNRQLLNFYPLQRKMIEAKKSNQIHFIQGKEFPKLKKIVTSYSALVHEVLNRYGKFPNLALEDTSEDDIQIRI